VERDFFHFVSSFEKTAVIGSVQLLETLHAALFFSVLKEVSVCVHLYNSLFSLIVLMIYLQALKGKAENLTGIVEVGYFDDNRFVTFCSDSALQVSFFCAMI
jgi:hypothetical protein